MIYLKDFHLFVILLNNHFLPLRISLTFVFYTRIGFYIFLRVGVIINHLSFILLFTSTNEIQITIVTTVL